MQPTLTDIEQALKRVWEYVRLFPYSEPIDETVMLTAMLTAVLRPLLPTAPGFAFDAPVQASGKSLLTKVLAELCGTTPIMTPYPSHADEPELRKSIFAMLLEGRPVIIIDNVVGEVDSSSLASVLTGDTYSDRILKASKSGTVSTNALILMSGNNILMKGDMPRRVFKCRINPKTETPHQRTFAFDPAEMVRTHRQAIVAAALTLFKGHFSANIQERLGQGRTASFDVWDDVVRQTVCWLAGLQKRGQLPTGDTSDGLACPRLVDPFEAIAGSIAADPTLLQSGRLLSAWASTIGTGYSAGTKLTVKQLAQTYCTFNTLPAIGSDPDSPTLPDVLVKIAGLPRSTDINTNKLGNYFAANVDHIIDGRCLRKGATYQSAVTWWVEDVGESRDSSESVSIDSNKSKVISISSKQNQLTKPTRLTGRSKVPAAAMNALAAPSGKH